MEIDKYAIVFVFLLTGVALSYSLTTGIFSSDINNAGNIGIAKGGKSTGVHKPDKRIHSADTVDPVSAPLRKRKIDKSYDCLSENLSRVSTIRVGLTEAANQGDHTAALNIISGLARLGFKGRIELILKAEDDEWPQLRRKLELLLQGYQASGAKIQTVRYSGLECICIPCHLLESYCEKRKRPLEQPLGFWPMNSNRSIIKTRTALVIPPFNWKNTIARLERHGSEVEHLELPCLANYQNTYTPDVTLAFNAIRGDSRAENLEKLLSTVQQDNVHLLPVYGIHHRTLESSHHLIIRRLIRGVALSHGNTMEKTYILILSSLPCLGRIRDEAQAQNIVFREMATEKWVESSGSPVELWYCGLVPRPLFEWICFVADRPMVQEGANTANFMNMLGKPYLPLNPGGDTGLPELDGICPDKSSMDNSGSADRFAVSVERLRVESLGNSLTHDLKVYSYYSVALDLCKKLRQLLAPMAMRTLAFQLKSMVLKNGYNDRVFRPALIEAIRYSAEPLRQKEKEWLDYLSQANASLPSTIPDQIRESLVKKGKALLKENVSLEKLIAFRTSGLNMAGLRWQLSELSFRRFEVLNGISVECPIIVPEVDPAIDIEELVSSICDNFSRLIPALFNIFCKDDSSAYLQDSIFWTESGRPDAIEMIVDQLLNGNMTYDLTIRSLIQPKGNEVDDLALYLRGGFGGTFFRQARERMMDPENDAIRCGLMKLTGADWDQIHSGTLF